MRTIVRKALNESASKRAVEEIYGPGKEEFLNDVVSRIKKQLEPNGFDIIHFAPIGKFILPPNVVTALNLKIEATQRAQMRENELREAEAQAQKQIAMANGKAASILSLATAQAKANKILASSVTPNLISYNLTQRWDGKLSHVSGNSTPIIKLPSAK